MTNETHPTETHPTTLSDSLLDRPKQTQGFFDSKVGKTTYVLSRSMAGGLGAGAFTVGVGFALNNFSPINLSLPVIAIAAGVVAIIGGVLFALNAHSNTQKVESQGKMLTRKHALKDSLVDAVYSSVLPVMAFLTVCVVLISLPFCCMGGGNCPVPSTGVSLLPDGSDGVSRTAVLS